MTLNDYVVDHGNGNNPNNPEEQEQRNQARNTELRVTSTRVQYVFNRVCHELERVQNWGDKPLLQDTECCGKDKCQHANEEEEMKKLVMVAMQLINIRDRLSLPSVNTENIKDVQYFELDLERLVNVCEKLRIPLLHYALEEKNSDSVDLLALPKAAILEELLDLGLDVNATNKNRDTPMHIVLRATEFRKSLVRSLLTRGANLYARNSEGEVVLDKMRKLQANDNEFVNFDDMKLGEYFNSILPPSGLRDRGKPTGIK